MSKSATYPKSRQRYEKSTRTFIARCFKMCSCVSIGRLIGSFGAARIKRTQAIHASRAETATTVSPTRKVGTVSHMTVVSASARSAVSKSYFIDAGWGHFQQIVMSKAAYAGRMVLCVNPRSTSQVCSQCATVRKKSLEERRHSCQCGCELDRDTNAAINILRLGSNQRGARLA
jgi:Putative transposase DNA-binding domain